MKHTDAIKMIMKNNSVTQQDIAIELGLNSVSGISRLLNRKVGRVGRIIDILDMLGYELVARPKTEKDCPDEYVLTLQDYRDESSGD